MRTRIPFKLWCSWTPKERADVMSYYETNGIRYMLDLSDFPPDEAKEIEKDYDEARENQDWRP